MKSNDVFFLSNQERYLNSIQALRAIAFLAVVTYHCGLTPGGPWGVSVFLVLSGFCMFYGYGHKSFSRSIKRNVLFGLRRIRKFYPLHIVLMMFVIFRECIEQQAVCISWVRVCMDFLLLTSWFPSTVGIVPYNGVAWYLSTIWISYVLFGYAVRFVNKVVQNERQALLAMGVIYGIQIILSALLINLLNLDDRLARWLTYEFPLFRFGDFLIGCFLAKLFLMETESLPRKKQADIAELFSVFLVLISLLIYVLKRGTLGNEAVRYTLLFTPSTVMLVYVFAKMEGHFTKILTNRITMYIAKISASGFLIHQVVIYGVKTLIDGGGPWKSLGERVTVFIISFLITAIAATVYDRVYISMMKKTAV